MKLGLGTVQFGQSYGIANNAGQVNGKEVKNILDYAFLSGIDTLDTAISYGESEIVLGDVGVKDWNVISKLPSIPKDCTEIDAWISNQVDFSLKRLGIKCLEGLLLHNPSQLLTPNGKLIWNSLIKLREENKVKKIGFSIYMSEDLELLMRNFQPCIVQAPYNIIDRRLADLGWLEKMYKSGIEIHVRSIFLQGLLLFGKKDRPIFFDKWSHVWDKWHQWLEELDLTALEACLSFALGDERISKVIVGVDSNSHLKEILSSANTLISDFPKELCVRDSGLIDPTNWDFL